MVCTLCPILPCQYPAARDIQVIPMGLVPPGRGAVWHWIPSSGGVYVLSRSSWPLLTPLAATAGLSGFIYCFFLAASLGLRAPGLIHISWHRFALLQLLHYSSAAPSSPGFCHSVVCFP